MKITKALLSNILISIALFLSLICITLILFLPDEALNANLVYKGF